MREDSQGRKGREGFVPRGYFCRTENAFNQRLGTLVPIRRTMGYRASLLTDHHFTRSPIQEKSRRYHNISSFLRFEFRLEINGMQAHWDLSKLAPWGSPQQTIGRILWVT